MFFSLTPHMQSEVGEIASRSPVVSLGRAIFGGDERIGCKRDGLRETRLREISMDSQTSGSRSHTDWRRLHALGLPGGSVRALLAVLVFVTTWGLLIIKPNQEVPDYLRDLLFIILGHYFAIRRRSGATQEPGPPPLYLPRGSVRLFLVVGSVAVAALLFRHGQLTALNDNPGVVTLLLIGGFLAGVAVNTVATWWRDRGHHTPRIVEDLRALISMAAAAILVAIVWNHVLLLFPTDSVDAMVSAQVHLGHLGIEHLLAAVVGFYFGSRS